MCRVPTLRCFFPCFFPHLLQAIVVARRLPRPILPQRMRFVPFPPRALIFLPARVPPLKSIPWPRTPSCTCCTGSWYSLREAFFLVRFNAHNVLQRCMALVGIGIIIIYNYEAHSLRFDAPNVKSEIRALLVRFGWR